MLTAHAVLALVLIAASAAAAVWGFAAYRRQRGGAALSHLLVLAQTLLIGQVALGLLLLSDGRRTADDLHYAYGSLALAAVLAPWFYAPAEGRKRLLWFSVATLLAGALATRAFLTGRS